MTRFRQRDVTLPGTPSTGHAATYRLVQPPVRITCVEEVPRELAREWIDAWVDWFGPDRCGSGASSEGLDGVRGGRVALVRTGGAEFVAKRHEPSLSRRVLYALRCRPSRSRAAFRLGLALAAAGIETSRPLALIERRPQGMGLRQESCLVLERVEGKTLRDTLLDDVLAGPGPERRKKRLFADVARAVARFHAAGFRQRDLKASNVLVSPVDETGGADGWTVSLIDFDGMSRFREAPLRRVRVRDLARLGVSLRAEDVVAGGVNPRDWRDLVATYLETFGGEEERRQLDSVLAETQRWGTRKIRRNRRRRRPIT